MDSTTQAIDDMFGAVELMLDRASGCARVSGKEIPTTEILRRPVDELSEHIPIGTRDPNKLRMLVNGAAATLTPGKGRTTRGSYKVRVATPSASWLFTPESTQSHRLVLGRRYDGNNEIGSFTRHTNGFVWVEWSRTVSFAGATARAVAPTAEYASIGYALAAAFGTGAQFMVGAVLDGIGALLPG